MKGCIDATGSLVALGGIYKTFRPRGVVKWRLLVRGRRRGHAS